MAGQALKPDQTSRSQRAQGAAKGHPKAGSLAEDSAGAALFQVHCAS